MALIGQFWIWLAVRRPQEDAFTTTRRTHRRVRLHRWQNSFVPSGHFCFRGMAVRYANSGRVLATGKTMTVVPGLENLRSVRRRHRQLCRCEWSPGSVPPERERDRGGDEESAHAGEPGGDVEMLVDDGEGAGQVGQGVLELAGVLGAVERGAGSGGDPLERGIVSYQRVMAPDEPAEAAEPAELRACAHQGCRVGGAESDREDAHVAVGGLPRRG